MIKRFVFTFIMALASTASGRSEVVTYRCTAPLVGKDLEMHISLDTAEKSVRQSLDMGEGPIVLEYLDHAARRAKASTSLGIPVLHFVRFTEDTISFGSSVNSVEQGTTINRKTGEMRWSFGMRGRCLQVPSTSLQK